MNYRNLVVSLVFALIGCESSEHEHGSAAEPDSEISTEMSKDRELQDNRDTIFTVWELDFDTISTTEKVRIENDIHTLDIRTYSLNDSSITWVNTLNRNHVFVDTYHDTRSDVCLRFKNDTVLNFSVTKETFKDSLQFGDGFYDRAVLGSFTYDFIRSNRLYFNFTVYQPDTDIGVSGDMAIFYRTNKKGLIDSYNFKDIGD